jgi:hypothetical protein
VQLRAAFLYTKGGRIATYGNDGYAVQYHHDNPATGSSVLTDGPTVSRAPVREEKDPMMADLLQTDPGPAISYSEFMGQRDLFWEGADPFNRSGGCTLDGMPISCSDAMHRLDVGSAVYDTITTVYYRASNGDSGTFVGHSTLAPGQDYRFTGRRADLATIGFLAASFNSFETGVQLAIRLGSANYGNSREGGLGSILAVSLITLHRRSGAMLNLTRTCSKTISLLSILA